jgi:hypothetical protein
MAFWRRKRHEDDDYPYPIESLAEQSSNAELLAAEAEVNAYPPDPGYDPDSLA